MKNALLLALVITLFGCQKEDTSNQVPGPNGAAPIKASYTMVLVNDYKHIEGDTLQIRINDALIGISITNTVYSHPTKLKSGDVVSIYYNPGVVNFSGSVKTDENNLKLYLNDEIWQETKCRCILNVKRTVP
jgi:hypothetical protein